jgi:transcriptional regulator with XRE-family HTH domain
MSPIRIALLKARKAAGLTQVQLSERAGVSQSAISDMEAGTTVRLNLEALDRICAVLNVEPGELLEREPKRTGKKRK